MDSDLMLLGGRFLALLAIPTVISAFSADRFIKGSVALSAIGGTLMHAAYATKPEGYLPDQIPDVIGSVLGRVMK